ncbi:hypothetical protein OPT61_g3871 [Boeremia exigua]|uniref:Uncharacterized protein n=1 Tax=Boeremia exigua TaxID=749465 RepID=A0ACC2IG54_9PLEO|nr:hypothetical protein OPT61_g3871 [Boeremia exigua]
MLHGAGLSDLVWGSLGRRIPSPKPVWSGVLGALHLLFTKDLRAESKVSAADRGPRTRHRKVRARRIAKKQDPSLWGNVDHA